MVIYVFYDGFIAGLVVRGGREVKGVGAAIRGGGEGCYEGTRGGLGGGGDWDEWRGWFGGCRWEDGEGRVGSVWVGGVAVRWSCSVRFRRGLNERGGC